MKTRIDRLLVARGLVESREKAQALILAGLVLVDEQRIDKPGHMVREESAVRLKGKGLAYVGRGGLKLEAALDAFHVDPTGGAWLDVGASTGGFTDCLLQRGAARVTAVDVGHNQLDYRLRIDPRIEVREGVNARHMKPEEFDGPFDGIVADLSFISLTLVLPALVPLVRQDGIVIVLVKPQFEAGRGEVGKGGIVRDDAVRHRVLVEVTASAEALGFERIGAIESPIAGAEGNREILLALRRRSV